MISVSVLILLSASFRSQRRLDAWPTESVSAPPTAGRLLPHERSIWMLSHLRLQLSGIFGHYETSTSVGMLVDLVCCGTGPRIWLHQSAPCCGVPQARRLRN